ncbi:BZ3500_MvSof-1268-A1-R1_Chr3-1g05592 [Microbotryum saponariae]|uniref:BZ3500_MvSof-1268-A1-R1_Chr3-1g05592 protein n=1 Tax=Microbotryum saponariae TaxID=289078 RepID=A0A2X0L033_9BASI|nr:BZ3500_MvSof-1268-A1-R1_Chr3-1g05592 [Microbotryum saponariae]SDA04782.1 BZ3501_MvSof-1269-A2-R1_Chr3-1g05262 [Microbotryum saponariae]
MRALADAHRLWRGAPFWPSQGLYSHFVIPSVQLGPNPFPTSSIYSYQGSTLRSFAERIEEHDSVLSLSRLKKHKNQPDPKIVRYYQPSPHYISLSGIPDSATIAAIKASRARPLSTPSVTQHDYTFAYLPRNAPHPLLSPGFYCPTSLDGMAKVSPGALLLAETLRNISTRSVQGTTFRVLLKKRYQDDASLEMLYSNGGDGRACASKVGAVGGYPGAEAFYPGVTVGGFKDPTAQAARGAKGGAAGELAGRATRVALIQQNPAKYRLIGQKAVAVANDVKHRKRMQKLLDGTWETHHWIHQPILTFALSPLPCQVKSVHPREAHVVVTKRYKHSKYFKVVKRDKKGWYSLEGRQLKAFVKVAVPQIFAAEPNWSATLRVVDATTGLAVKEWAFDRDHTRYAPSKPGPQNPFGPELSDTTRNHFSDLAKDIPGFLQLTTAKALPGARVAELPASAESIEMVDEADPDDDDDERLVIVQSIQYRHTGRHRFPSGPSSASPSTGGRPPHARSDLDNADHEYLDLTLDDANSESDFIDLTLDALEPAPKRYRRNFNDGTLRTWLKSAGRA